MFYDIIIVIVVIFHLTNSNMSMNNNDWRRPSLVSLISSPCHIIPYFLTRNPATLGGGGGIGSGAIGRMLLNLGPALTRPTKVGALRLTGETSDTTYESSGGTCGESERTKRKRAKSS